MMKQASRKRKRKKEEERNQRRTKTDGSWRKKYEKIDRIDRNE